MISYNIYKILHLVSMFAVILSLGGVCMHLINGGAKSSAWKKAAAITHGVGMLFILVAGFGLLARLGMITGLPGWAIAKLVIWAVFGILTAVLYRKPTVARAVWFLVLVLGGTAGYLAIYKPF